MPRAFEGTEGQWYSQAEVDSAAAAARREGKTAGAKEATDDYEGLSPKELRELKAAHDKAQADLKAATDAADAAKAETAKLKGEQAAREVADKNRTALKAAGFRDDRADRLLKDLPDGADLSDAEKAKPVLDKLKADYPEWLGTQQTTTRTQTTQTTAKPNGVSASPQKGDEKPVAPSLREGLQNLVAPKSA